MNSTIYIRNGKYHAETRIQDGTERSEPLQTLDEAKKWCKDCERIMNGLKIKKRDIPIVVEHYETAMTPCVLVPGHFNKDGLWIDNAWVPVNGTK